MVLFQTRLRTVFPVINPNMVFPAIPIMQVQVFLKNVNSVTAQADGNPQISIIVSFFQSTPVVIGGSGIHVPIVIQRVQISRFSHASRAQQNENG
jgi:hypothetical protein